MKGANKNWVEKVHSHSALDAVPCRAVYMLIVQHVEMFSFKTSMREPVVLCAEARPNSHKQAYTVW